MKKINKYILPLAAILSLASCNIIGGKDDEKEETSEEGNTSEIEESTNTTVDDTSSNSPSTTLSDDFTIVDTDVEVTSPEVDYTSAIQVDLSNLASSSDFYTLKKNVLTLDQAGTYELTGTLNGSIKVPEEEITIILNNATIKTLDSQAVGAIVFKKENPNPVNLVVKEGTTNYLYDSVGDLEATDEDADEGVIVVKGETTLTISGSGTLNIETLSLDSSGIKVKDTNLTIIDTKINITATKNGIKAGKGLYLSNTTLDITATNDGIKTDMTADTAENALLYASDYTYGYMYIENSDITVDSGDDGIVADSYMHIVNEGHTITVKTNGGCPTTVSERSSDSSDGKAIKVGGITLEDDNGNETDYPSTTDIGYYLVIESGTFNLNSNDDAITSKGNLYIKGGTYTISTGDDGLHSEYITKVEGGNITINKSYEGVEGANVEITGGTLNITASDDGINAANGDLTNYTYYIYIGGGKIYIDASGDGIDSNGVLEINGGTTIVNGPTNDGNASLDADQGILINGGNVIAIGSSGMVELPNSSSKQASVGWNLTSSCSSGTKVTFTVNDVEVITTTATKSFNSVIASSNGLKSGDSIKISVGSSSQTATISNTITTFGTFSGTGSTGGQQGGGTSGGSFPGGQIGGPGYRGR